MKRIVMSLGVFARTLCALMLALAVSSACAQSRGVAVETAKPAAVPATASTAPALEVRYLANEGFLVEAGDHRVILDGLFGSGIAGYATVPPDLRAELETGVGEWGDVGVAMATHFHGDHFDPGSVARFLEANPTAIFVSTPQAIERLTQSLATQAKVSRSNRIQLLTRVRGVLPEEGAIETLEIDGVEIDVLNLHHGRRTPPVQNLGFVVTVGEIRFLHLGDTEAKMEDFEPYLDRLRGIDLALLPFWFLSSEWRAEMVRDLIRPRWILVAHMPTPDAPPSYFGRWQSYEELVRSIAAAFPDARFPSQAGERYRFGDAD